jgi:hypothetical protein
MHRTARSVPVLDLLDRPIQTRSMGPFPHTALRSILLLGILLVGTQGLAQSLSDVRVKVEPKTVLHERVRGSSGLVIIDNAFWTHGDGAKQHLHRIAPDTAEVLGSVTLWDHRTDDWEDIAQDDSCIYIADVGNSSGLKTKDKDNELRIYGVHKSKLAQAENLSRDDKDYILFTYPPAEFRGGPDPAYAKDEKGTPAHHWDCEAMAVMGPHVYLFTKNWRCHGNAPRADCDPDKNGHTSMYKLYKRYTSSNRPHTAEWTGTLDAQGLVTGAAVDAPRKRLALVGSEQGSYKPFLIIVEGFPDAPLAASATRYLLDICPAQVEAVAWGPTGELYITCEKEIDAPITPATLWRVLGEEVEGRWTPMP